MLLRVLLLVLIPAPLLAAGSQEPFSLLSGSLRVIGALGLIVGVVLVAFALLKRRGNLFPGSRSSRIKVCEIRPLGPKKSLVLVEVAGRELLLGVGQERISLLTELPTATPADFGKELDRRLEEGR